MKCEACHFFRDPEKVNDTVILGLCHRYPKSVEVATDWWCGEWKAKDLDLRPA